MSLRCEWRHSSHGETVCQTVCYTVRSHVLSLRALTLWSTILHSPSRLVSGSYLMSKSWNELLCHWRSGSRYWLIINALSLCITRCYVVSETEPHIDRKSRFFISTVAVRISAWRVVWENKKLSYCWETVRRESMPRIAEMDVEMTT